MGLDTDFYRVKLSEAQSYIQVRAGKDGPYTVNIAGVEKSDHSEKPDYYKVTSTNAYIDEDDAEALSSFCGITSHRRNYMIRDGVARVLGMVDDDRYWIITREKLLELAQDALNNLKEHTPTVTLSEGMDIDQSAYHRDAVQYLNAVMRMIDQADYPEEIVLYKYCP